MNIIAGFFRVQDRLALSGMILGSIPMISGAAPIPASIKTTTFNNEHDANLFSVVRAFQDGFGRDIRSLFVEGAGDVVAGVLYDDFGRPRFEPKAYYSQSHDHGWSSAADLISEANGYYDGSTVERPDAESKAFSEYEYYPDALGRVRRIGRPGLEYSLESQNYHKYWYIGVTGRNFIGNPTESMADAKASEPTARYFLTVERDPNGDFSQTIKDMLGRKVKTWKDPGASPGDEIVTQYAYDIQGNLLRVDPPGTDGQPDPSMSSWFGNNTDGTLYYEIHPDAGRTDFTYDRAGRLRFTQTQIQRHLPETHSYNYRKYDRLDRLVEEGTYTYATSSPGLGPTQDLADDPDFPPMGDDGTLVHARYFYDRIDGLSVQLGIPESSLRNENLQGRLVGRIAFNRLFDGGVGFPIAESFSYDIEGRVRTRHIHMPVSSSLGETIIYDLQGRIRFKEAALQYATPRTKEFIYDGQGRLQSMLQNGATVVNYQYTKTGLLADRIYLPWSGDGETGRTSMQYNIRDWPSRILGTNTLQNTYEETLEFDQAANPRYNGDVGRAVHKYVQNDGYTRTFPQSYSYDRARRLTGTYYQYADFQEAYAYDAKGRITHLLEGSREYGPYDYDLGTNRLMRIDNHPTRSNPNDNFVYDPNGNMVFDRSKSMAVQYDWRGMPARFIFYSDLSSIANSTPHWSSVLNLGQRRAVVDMAYDADGKRLFKETKHQ